MDVSRGRVGVLLLCTALLAACGTSQPTRYYVLSASAPEPAGASDARELTVGVGPIMLPPYLDRRELVSRTGSNELNVPVYHQWAEPLAENISRVVGEDLGRRLQTDRIVHLPVDRALRRALSIDYQVVIALQSFEKVADGAVLLDARWAILNDDKRELVLRRARYRQTPTAEGHAAQAAALSQLLGRLTEEIALAIAEMEAKRQS